MEYDVNGIEFAKTKKKQNNVMQMREHIFCIKSIFSLCSNMFCEMFYLLCCPH